MQNKIKLCIIFRLYIIWQEGKEMDFAWASEQSEKLVETAYADVGICVCIHIKVTVHIHTHTQIYIHTQTNPAQHFTTDM